MLQKIVSPDGSTEISICLSEDGALRYSVSQDGITVVQESDMGIATSVGDFTTGLEFVAEETREINETYPMLSGKRKLYTNHCKEKILHFVKKGIRFDLTARSYDNGIAFRYSITAEKNQKMTIAPNAEVTSFRIPDDSRFWYMPRDNRDFMYEGNYLSEKLAEAEPGTLPSLPMLYETSGKNALIMEADRHGNYVGSLLKLEAGGVMRMIFDIVQDTPVSTEAPFVSPWRTVIIGSPADILQNNMVENLSPAPDPAYDFASWVEPGVTAWSWISFYGRQDEPEVHKAFIDLAADMGWKYYILDEQWQPKSDKPNICYEGMNDWFADVKAHADKKGIKLIAWVNKLDVAKKEDRLARFKEWSEAGIAGIKVDFFFNDSQEMLQLYDDIYKDAAKYRLLVNAHGSNPPSGELRTFPNALAREAIRGQEQGGITVQQYTLIPFLRAAVGTADVTEQLYSRDTEKTTMGFQIALSTLIENGMHSMGSKPEEYASIPASVDLYKNFPHSWDDLYVIDAEVGVQVNVARKAGEAWYAAGISVEERSFAFKPEFLDKDKSYTATVYREKDGERQDIEMELLKGVTATTALSVHVANGGGYTIRFVPEA